MALSGGILAQISYEQFLPEKTCNDPTTTMERIGISLSVISALFVGATSSSVFGFVRPETYISAFLALLIHVAAVFDIYSVRRNFPLRRWMRRWHLWLVRWIHPPCSLNRGDKWWSNCRWRFTAMLDVHERRRGSDTAHIIDETPHSGERFIGATGPTCVHKGDVVLLPQSSQGSTIGAKS